MGDPARKWDSDTSSSRPSLVAVETPASQPSEPKSNVAPFVWSVLSLALWVIPLFGLPAAIFAVVRGFDSYRKHPSGLALVTMILGTVGLAASVANAIYGAYLGATGRLPFQQN